MAEGMTKVLLPNQCDLLHQYYTITDCCLCKANDRIKELEARAERLLILIELLLLSSCDGRNRQLFPNYNKTL